MSSHSHVLVVYIYIISWPLTNRHLLGVASHLLSLWCNRIQLIQQHKRHQKYSHLSTHELDESNNNNNNNNNNRNISHFPASPLLLFFLLISSLTLEPPNSTKKNTPKTTSKHQGPEKVSIWTPGPKHNNKTRKKTSKPQEVDIFRCLDVLLEFACSMLGKHLKKNILPNGGETW